MADLSIELWAVTETDLSGVTHVAVTSSRDEAVSHFMQSVYLFMHAAPEQKFIVVGDDADAALTGLHLIWKGDELDTSLASVTRPASITSKPGYVPFAAGDASFADVAAEINAAIELNHGRLEPHEIRQLAHSSAAMTLFTPLAEELSKLGETVEHKKVSKAKAKRMWAAMRDVDQYISMTVVVQG